MRTSLDIDDDVLQAVRERAVRERKTVGHLVSDLLRSALSASAAESVAHERADALGLRPFARRGSLVTNELIDRLRCVDHY